MPFTPAELEERRKFLGASEAAAAIGLSDYFTPYQLYLSKKGQGEPIEETIPMIVGTALEPACLALFEKHIGKPVTHRQHQVIDPDWQVRRATLDGLIDGDTGVEVVQAKSSGGAWMGWGKDEDEVPQPIVYQVHHEMMCVGAKVAWVPVILGARTFRVYRVQRDEELCELLDGAEFGFWGHVANNSPPAPSTPVDIKLLYPKDCGTVVCATVDIESLVIDHGAIKQRMKADEAKCDELETQIQAFMGQAATLLDSHGRPLVTWKSHDENRLDVARIRKERPDIAAEYGKVSTVRKFLNKVK